MAIRIPTGNEPRAMSMDVRRADVVSGTEGMVDRANAQLANQVRDVALQYANMEDDALSDEFVHKEKLAFLKDSADHEESLSKELRGKGIEGSAEFRKQREEWLSSRRQEVIGRANDLGKGTKEKASKIFGALTEHGVADSIGTAARWRAENLQKDLTDDGIALQDAAALSRNDAATMDLVKEYMGRVDKRVARNEMDGAQATAAKDTYQRMALEAYLDPTGKDERVVLNSSRILSETLLDPRTGKKADPATRALQGMMKKFPDLSNKYRGMYEKYFDSIGTQRATAKVNAYDSSASDILNNYQSFDEKERSSKIRLDMSKAIEVVKDKYVDLPTKTQAMSTHVTASTVAELGADLAHIPVTMHSQEYVSKAFDKVYNDRFNAAGVEVKNEIARLTEAGMSDQASALKEAWSASVAGSGKLKAAVKEQLLKENAAIEALKRKDPDEYALRVAHTRKDLSPVDAHLLAKAKAGDPSSIASAVDIIQREGRRLVPNSQPTVPKEITTAILEKFNNTSDDLGRANFLNALNTGYEERYGSARGIAQRGELYSAMQENKDYPPGLTIALWADPTTDGGELVSTIAKGEEIRAQFRSRIGKDGMIGSEHQLINTALADPDVREAIGAVEDAFGYRHQLATDIETAITLQAMREMTGSQKSVNIGQAVKTAARKVLRNDVIGTMKTGSASVVYPLSLEKTFRGSLRNRMNHFFNSKSFQTKLWTKLDVQRSPEDIRLEPNGTLADTYRDHYQWVTSPGEGGGSIGKIALRFFNNRTGQYYYPTNSKGEPIVMDIDEAAHMSVDDGAEVMPKLPTPRMWKF